MGLGEVVQNYLLFESHRKKLSKPRVCDINIRMTVNTFERPRHIDKLDRKGAMTGYRAFRRTDLEPSAGQ